MQKRQLGKTDIRISPMIFGANVFGWTADEATSFELLDGFTGAGLETIDTADVYSNWAPGNQGGESETIIGKWLQSRQARNKIILITKVGYTLTPEKKGLSAAYIERAVEDSLKRLQTDHIDIYLSHIHDDSVPYEETLRAHERLIQAGKVRFIGASNHNAAQLAAALATSVQHQLPRYEVLQPEYNLYDRAGFDAALQALTTKEHIGVITYFSLAKGFLSGKYRSKDDTGQSPRGSRIGDYLNDRGFRILDALDKVAANHQATPAEIALAWLIHTPAVTAPIASATSLKQLNSLVKATQVQLTPEDMSLLDSASK